MRSQFVKRHPVGKLRNGACLAKRSSRDPSNSAFERNFNPTWRSSSFLSFLEAYLVGDGRSLHCVVPQRRAPVYNRGQVLA